ncbi:MAG: hypothetical protein J5505_05485, partial [Spirochaetaceae bacterium]|nr:hypothetical protein [Spirochaetaceae bacterium]
MKTIVIFYDNDSAYQNEKVFDGKSAVEMSSQWATWLGLESFSLKSATLAELLADMKTLCTENQAETVLFSYIDLPFLNKSVSKKILDSHIEYKSEYTFADGYPYGFTPEALNAGTIGILAELAKSTQKTLGDAPVTRDGIYNHIKTDINSFDVETIIADSDFRLLRLAFHCGKKDNFLQSKALFEETSKTGLETGENADAEKLSELASKNPACLKTVPGFYNIQIADGRDTKPVYEPECTFGAGKKALTSENFAALCKKISDFSESAVLNLSFFCEPLLN